MPPEPSCAQSQKVMPACGNRSEIGMKAEPIMPKACSMPWRCRTFTKASSVVIFMADILSSSPPSGGLIRFVPEEIPAVHGPLADAAEGGQEAMPRQGGGEDRQVEPTALAGDKLRHAAAGLGGIHHAVAAIAHGVEDLLLRVGLDNARHHVVADIDPAPPGIVDVDPLQRRELAAEPVDQELEMARVLRIAAGDGAAAADLHAPVRHLPIVEAQCPRIGQDDLRP